MKKIVITTTSFGEYNKLPLILLKERGVEIKFNPYSRKLEKNEVVELCKNSIGAHSTLKCNTWESGKENAILSVYGKPIQTSNHDRKRQNNRTTL